MKILYLIDSLDYSGSARQLRLLGPVLAKEDQVEICCLGPSHPWEQSLRQTGLTVHTLHWTRWFDPSVLWHVRKILQQFAPDLIHVWRMPALRALAAVAPELLPRVVMSAPLPANGELPWWDRWLLGRVRCLAIAGVSEERRCVQEGLIAQSLRVVPPAVAGPDPARAESEPIQSGLSIVCVGKLEREEGFRLAIWAHEILRHLYVDLQLLLVGAGSQQPALAALAHGLGSSGHVRFMGERADVTSLLRGASVVWVPSAANCGRQVALEAMAQGTVVIATAVPCLREVVADGETGYLVPPGAAAPFARRTHAIFKDAGLRERLGQAALRRVRQQFSLADAAQRWREVYQNVAA